MSTENYKVVHVSGNGKTKPYDPVEHRDSNNFLVWDGLIIIGWSMFHNRLFRAYPGREKSEDLIGAGNCSDGKITGWRSMGYGVTTPEDLRSGICASLSMTDDAE